MAPESLDVGGGGWELEDGVAGVSVTVKDIIEDMVCTRPTTQRREGS